jgi:hypothetical protein
VNGQPGLEFGPPVRTPLTYGRPSGEFAKRDEGDAGLGADERAQDLRWKPVLDAE